MTPESQAGVGEAIVVLALGAAAIVVLAGIAERIFRSAVWQRAAWQAAVASMLGLVVMEISGAAPAAIGLVRCWLSEGDLAVGAASSTVAEPFVVPAPAGTFVAPVSADEFAVPASAGLLPPQGGTTNLPPSEDGTAREVTLVRGGARAIGWLGVLWACGAGLLAARTAHGRMLLGRFRRAGARVTDVELLARILRLRVRLGMDRPVTVLESTVLSAPVAFGCRRPTIALPAGFAHDFDPAQQEAMLAHELAHLAAGDSAWQLAAEAVAAVLWWHPAVWWAIARLRAASELAADEASLLVPDGPDVLAGCLVAFGQRLTRRRRLGWVAMEGTFFRSGLGRRVERLLSLPDGADPATDRRWPKAAGRVLPAVMVAMAVSCTAWARPQAGFAEGETTMRVLQSSLGRSLAAATLAAVLSPIGWDADAAGPPERPPRPDAVVGDAEPPKEADREEVRRGDREGPRRPGPEAQLLGRQIEVLRSALPALREANKMDAVEVLERAIHAREIMLSGRRDDEANQIREHAPPPGQLAEILGMTAGLWREFKDPGKAEALKRLADELARPQDQPREGERAEGERGRPREAQRPEAAEREQRILEDRQRREIEDRERQERLEISQRLIRQRDELRARAIDIERELRELGRELADPHPRMQQLRAELERIAAESREIDARLGELSRRREGPPPGAPFGGPPPAAEAARRMQHLRIAVDNLHAAGLHEQAERLMQEAERLMHEGRGREAERGGAEPGQRPGGPPPGRGGEGPPRDVQRPGGRVAAPSPGAVEEQLHGVIRQLRGELEGMQRQMEEMRRQMERIAAPRGEQREAKVEENREKE